MMKTGPVALFVSLAITIAGCGAPMEQNQTASQNVTPAPPASPTNLSVNENIAVANTMTNEAQPLESVPPPTEPRRTPSAPKAAPRSQAAQPADPHAGHDMGNMMHNGSSGQQ